MDYRDRCAKIKRGLLTNQLVRESKEDLSDIIRGRTKIFSGGHDNLFLIRDFPIEDVDAFTEFIELLFLLKIICIHNRNGVFMSGVSFYSFKHKESVSIIVNTGHIR